ncbi:hypothetical protein DRJ17_03090 [Candidatus Woesearchaeota archaeon]|nr:MAG: hypothetical protein DRJ17_03090 [Candidatus Woesearchaeota archaeon]
MDFKILGLNKYESKVYEALVKLGKSSASKISSHSGVPYSRVYDILESLIRKHLVKIVPEKIKLFIASDPENLNKLLKKRRSELEQLNKDINELKKHYEEKEREQIFVAKGARSFNKLVREVKARKFSYKIRYTSEFSHHFIKEFKEEKKRGAILKTLARYDKETKENLKKWLKIDKNIRAFDNDAVAIKIYEGGILISLISPPHPGNEMVLIKNKAVADVMKRLFEAAYEKAPKIQQR